MYMYNELYLKVNIQTYFYQNVWHIGYKILIYLKWVLDWNMVIVFSILNFVIDVWDACVTITFSWGVCLGKLINWVYAWILQLIYIDYFI